MKKPNKHKTRKDNQIKYVLWTYGTVIYTMPQALVIIFQQ